MDFFVRGMRIKESTHTKSKTLAKEIARKRRAEIETGNAGIRKPEVPRSLAAGAEEWLTLKQTTVKASTLRIYRDDLAHLLPSLGRKRVCEIEATDVARYQQARIAEGASAKTVNLELGTLRAILKRKGAWARIQPDVRMLPTRDDAGRAITAAEEAALLEQAARSRSRALHTFVTLSLATGARFNVIRTLTWAQVDLERGVIRYGQDKTAAGTGNVIPLNARAVVVLQFRAAQFQDRKPEHYVLPRERYGWAGKRGPQGGREAAQFAGGIRLRYRSNAAGGRCKGSLGGS